MADSRLPPHRLGLIAVALVIVTLMVVQMQWGWLPEYREAILDGLWLTVVLMVTTSVAGFLLAIPLGLVQVKGPRPLAWLARGFCTLIRGTPLLLQVWLLYYGLGSLFPYLPGVRQSWLWPYLIESWPYAFAALTLSFAGYEGEVMRGAFAGVPKGELEAARSLGMHPLTILRRIWLPRAVQRVLPTLNGELVIQLKATPLVATIAAVDTYAVFGRIRQETYMVYEPLLLMALIYLVLAGLITLAFAAMERAGSRGR
ncbi:ABC transporter permease [Halomonas saccharevitans]|uniref:Arginine ABC transporter permease protein ArtM n=1 Tax=Halomonas saccharevitans TaxID=416872 RepID=A0A1I7CGM0_9GAMM|nr:ABC transporter permease subunit [Halomonas saccharevitans]SFT98600.1 amino acid ABC transporter membrane protein 2, PAAT family (TC 3.A.1.3.-) [Halomonas saccharevitans]